MRRAPLLVAALASAAALVLPAAANARPDVTPARAFDVPQAFAKSLDKVRQTSGIDVLLPSTIAVHGSTKVYGSTDASTGTYSLDLGYGKNCFGANVCSLAFFFGEEGGKPAYTKKVTLAGGKTGYFKPLTCGASCSPPAIQWMVGTVLYEIQYKGASQKREKKVLIALANQANAAGAR